MRGTVFICGLILAAAIAVTVILGFHSREVRAAAPAPPNDHQNH